MDLTFTEEQNRFRDNVREWLHTHKPKEERPRNGQAVRDFDLAWQQKQYKGGWAGISWPEEYGGCGLPLIQQLIWHEEYAKADAPYVGSCYVGLNHAGPTLIMKANGEQRAHYLPSILRGESIWCQGFSEPGSGSDLASLKMRADIDGDDLVVNGQKIWTSFAQISDFQELLVRTDNSGVKHHGITWVIADLKLPGIEIRPIETMANDFHFCEVFYTDVRIPLANVVGEINDGWRVAQSTLSFERGTGIVGVQVEIGRNLEQIIKMASEIHDHTGKPLHKNDEFARRFAVARAEVNAMKAMTYSMISRIEANTFNGPEASLIRVYSMELYKRVAKLATEIFGPRIAMANAKSIKKWAHLYLESFKQTIGGGTSEIQRNIIGERLLELPREK